MYVLDRLTDLLTPRLRPAAKAVYPLATAVLTAGASWAVSGNLNTTEIRTAAGGGVLALITFLVPNRS